MTNYQDLVLAKIDEEISKVEVWLEEADEVWTSETALDDARKHLGFMNALRAVAEIHEWIIDELSDTKWCKSCYTINNDGVLFPCPTSRAIGEKLGVTE